MKIRKEMLPCISSIDFSPNAVTPPTSFIFWTNSPRVCVIFSPSPVYGLAIVNANPLLSRGFSLFFRAARKRFYFRPHLVPWVRADFFIWHQIQKSKKDA